MKKISLFVVLIVSLSSCSAFARSPAGPITYDGLLEVADTVVIATAISNTITGVTNILTYDCDVVETVFLVRAKLKGGSNNQMIVRHLEFQHRPTGMNPPMLVHFQPSDPALSEAMAEPCYLLFLKKNAGVWEPASGQIDAVFSVRTVATDWLRLVQRK